MSSENTYVESLTGGTALLSKHKPISTSTDLPGHPDPDHVKGRIVTFEFEGCYVVATYVTNAGQGLKVPKLQMETHQVLSCTHRIDSIREKYVEPALYCIHTRPRQKEASHLDGRPQCRPNSKR